MRIATNMLHTMALNDMQRATTTLVDLQRQVGSERKSDDLKGYETSANTLISARGFFELSAAHVQATEEFTIRLNLQDFSLNEVTNAAGNLREFVTDAIALNNGAGLMNQLELAFANAVSSLNAASGGKYVFGGVSDASPPVNVASLDDLAALPAAADAFDNSQRRATAQLDSRTSVEAAALADEVAGDLFTSFKNIKDYHDNPATGPFGDPLTAAQATFLQTELSSIVGAVDTVIDHHAENGALQSRAEAFLQRGIDQRDYYERVVIDIEAVDLAQVAAQLSQTQTQLQASAQIYASIRNSTLLDVL